MLRGWVRTRPIEREPLSLAAPLRSDPTRHQHEYENGSHVSGECSRQSDEGARVESREFACIELRMPASYETSDRTSDAVSVFASFFVYDSWPTSCLAYQSAVLGDRWAATTPSPPPEVQRTSSCVFDFPISYRALLLRSGLVSECPHLLGLADTGGAAQVLMGGGLWSR